jgi:RecA-family ATPase
MNATAANEAMYERAEFAIAKIGTKWKGKSELAAVTAAAETGRLSGKLIGYDRAKMFVRTGFTVRQVDEKHWQTVSGAFQNARGTLSTYAELWEEYFSAAANDNQRFQVTWFDDVGQTITKDELVKGVLGTGEFSLFVAKPGTAKSVLLVDVGCHVAAGIDWHGRKVKQGLVVFFAAERKPLTERRILSSAQSFPSSYSF